MQKRWESTNTHILQKMLGSNHGEETDGRSGKSFQQKTRAWGSRARAWSTTNWDEQWHIACYMIA